MDILEFQGQHRWLSNFWPCVVELEGMQFQSVEAAYVAAKTTCMITRKEIQQLASAGDCKRYGRKLKLRPDWEEVKLEIMRQLLQQKFAKGSDLAIKLLKTGDCKIIEGNSWGDTFWGVCRGVGSNHLGNLIMVIRSQLKENKNA